MKLSQGTVIVNADDFGYSTGINRAIVTCFADRLISSTTIMANMPGFDEACELARANQLISRIGIHLNLTEGQPLLSELRDNSALCDDSGHFRQFRSRMLSGADRRQIAAEFTAQIQRCRRSGLPLTHADSHQHVHNEPMVLLATVPVLRENGIRHLRISRNMDSLPLTSAKSVAKMCFNQWIAFCGLRGTDYLGTVETFVRFRDSGLLRNSSFEILTHPLLDQNGTLIDHVDHLPLRDRLSHAFRGLQLSGYPGDESSENSIRCAA